MNNIEMNNFKRINKVKARNLYNKGENIYIVPCKVAPDFKGYWIQPFELNKERVENEYKGYPDLIARETFDKRVNAFEYYNCNSELGNYTAFYIIEQ